VSIHAIVEVKSKEEAVDDAKRFLRLVGEGESEVRVFQAIRTPAATGGTGL
jgi:hypothetical protein